MRDACAQIRPRRKSAYGPFSAANKSRDIGSAARRPLGATSSISFVCAAAWSSRSMGDSMRTGCKRTLRAPHGSRAKVFGSYDFRTTTCSATRTAWSRRFGKLFASQVISAGEPTTESMMANRLPDRTPDHRPLPNLPHQGGGVRKRKVSKLKPARRRHRGHATSLRAVHLERACLASAVFGLGCRFEQFDGACAYMRSGISMPRRSRVRSRVRRQSADSASQEACSAGSGSVRMWQCS